VLKSDSVQTNLELISDLKAILNAWMRRSVGILAWYLLLGAVLGILGRFHSLRDLERYSLGEDFAYATDTTAP
jgi:hypothetical protein